MANANATLVTIRDDYRIVSDRCEQEVRSELNAARGELGGGFVPLSTGPGEHEFVTVNAAHVLTLEPAHITEEAPDA